MDLVGAFHKPPKKKLYCVNLYYIDILKLRTYKFTYKVLKKFQFPNNFATVIALLCVV